MKFHTEAEIREMIRETVEWSGVEEVSAAELVFENLYKEVPDSYKIGSRESSVMSYARIYEAQLPVPLSRQLYEFYREQIRPFEKYW